MPPSPPDPDRLEQLLSQWAASSPESPQATPTRPLVPRLAAASDLLLHDAWNSLNLAGIPVTRELVRTRAAKLCPPSPDDPWPAPDPAARIKAPEPRDFLPGEIDPVVLAALDGYLACQREFKLTTMRLLTGDAPGPVLEQDLPRWHRALMTPWSQAGLLQPQDIGRGRQDRRAAFPVKHTPPAPEDISACLHLLLARKDLLRHPVLAHLALLWIQPWSTGNGRLARLAHGAMMLAGGGSWFLIPAEQRPAYLAAVQTAFDTGDSGPLVRLTTDGRA